MTNLFTNQQPTTIQGGANKLSVTVELVRQTDTIANKVLAALLADQETNAPIIAASQTDPAALDNLILGNVVITDEIDIDGLKANSEEELTKALKSQQSKRSRAKGDTMTQANYIKMLSAGIAEHALRLALGKPKGSSGRVGTGASELTDERIEAYRNDPAALGKAIRNIQSKKSIYKRRIDADFESDQWLNMLEVEQQLKDLRDEIGGVASKEAQEAIEANEKAAELLTDVDPSKLKADEAKKLLADIQEALATKA